MEYDFNKANYKSATFEYRENEIWFSVSGDDGLLVLLQSGGEMISRDTTKITFPISVIKSRFENALADLKNQCPGKKSKY